MQKRNIFEAKNKNTLTSLGIYDVDTNTDDIVKLIRKINRLMPINKPDKVEYLLEVISYIETLINGDAIAKYITVTHLTDYAKEALDEITKYIQEQTISTFKEEKQKLEQDISLLTTKKETLNGEITSITQIKKEMQENISNSRNELANIQAELDDKKQFGISRVQKAIEQERQRLEEENKKLMEQQKKLKEIIKSLKEELALYNSQITNTPQQQKKEVVWEPINLEHPIYNTNSSSIKDFIHSLKLHYCENMGCSMEQAELAFKMHCPELSTIKDILINYFSNNLNENAGSISRIITYFGWRTTLQMKAYSLNDMLKTMKLPNYQKVINTTTSPFAQSTIPDNMNVLVRELHYQKLTLEALIAKNIAEQNLQTVINILGQFLPSNFDLDSYLIKNSEPSSQDALLEKNLVKKLTLYKKQ